MNEILESNDQLGIITQDVVAHLDHENTNGEGWDYYSNGRILCATVYENEISGIIREYLEDFKVKITVGEHELYFSCSCDGQGSVCKHVIALLYSWVFDGNEFINIKTFIDELEQFDKGMLIKMMENIIRDDPRNVSFFKKESELQTDDYDLS